MDTAYNKDKLGIDKSKANEDQHTSGSMTNIIKSPEPLHSVPINGSLNPGESHEFANSEQNHVTNGQSFDTIFPGIEYLTTIASITRELCHKRSK